MCVGGGGVLIWVMQNMGDFIFHHGIAIFQTNNARNDIGFVLSVILALFTRRHIPSDLIVLTSESAGSGLALIGLTWPLGVF